MIGIYKFTNKINNKSYIGQSINIDARRKQHIASSYYPLSNTYNTAFHQAIRKYGVDNFNFEVLTICNIEELDTLEKYYISKYDSKFDDVIAALKSLGYKQGEIETLIPTLAK